MVPRFPILEATHLVLLVQLAIWWWAGGEVIRQRGSLGRTCLLDGPNGSHPTRGVFSSGLVMTTWFGLLNQYSRITKFLSGDSEVSMM